MTVRIVTDSACDLRGEEVDEFGIEVVPLSIRFGDREYVDREELSVTEFYALLAESDDLPETAAPAPGTFDAAFRRQFDAGASAVVCINLSAALSATMQSAQTAADNLKADRPDAEIHVVDSGSITAGLGSIVLAAAEMGRDGASATDIVAAVHDLSSRTQVFGTLDTLDNLKKGGRIGGAQALLGSMLAIKPILDLSSGEVEEAGKQRTRKKALGWLRDKLIEVGPVEKLAVMHGDAPDLDDFLAMLDGVVDVDTIRVEKIGPVIGTHGGPRVMGLAFQTPA
ncbi:MAG: DegV family protein [Acidimicrobiales bacterium]|nr:DegV family protein [Acidimicrobiales bacterium]